MSEPADLEPLPRPGRALYLVPFPDGETVRVEAADPEAAERRAREALPRPDLHLQVDSPEPEGAG